MRESDIAHETPRGFWVARQSRPPLYVVYRPNGAHSVSDSAYTLDADGLSIAKARADYLDKHAPRQAFEGRA
jgi:hypothetical protein